MKLTQKFLVSVLSFLLMILSAISGCAQSNRRKQTAKPVNPAAHDIQRVDFLNFSYPSLFCSKETRGFGRIVRVRNGNFQTDAIYFGVVSNKVIYEDVTGDGRAEAIIHIGCGEYSSNIGFSEIFVYTQQNEQTVLLAGLTDKDMETDYLRFFPKGTLWRITDNGVKVKNGNLIVQRFAEGSLSSPEYILTLEYALKGKNFVLQKRPQRLPRVTKK